MGLDWVWSEHVNDVLETLNSGKTPGYPVPCKDPEVGFVFPSRMAASSSPQVFLLSPSRITISWAGPGPRDKGLASRKPMRMSCVCDAIITRQKGLLEFPKPPCWAAGVKRV